MPDYAVECGGTKTDLYVIDGDRTDHHRVDLPSNFASLQEEGFNPTIRKAFAEIGVTDLSSSRIVAGVAGVDSSSTEVIAARAFTDLGAHPKSVRVMNDGQILLHAINAHNKIIYIGGTGSNSFGLSHDGKQSHAGGHGHWLGDPGSGFSAGMAALSEVIRQLEQQSARTSSLVEPVLAYFNLTEENWDDGIEDILYGQYPDESARKKFTAGVAPIVVEHAVAGDHVAQSILYDQADAMAEQIMANYRQLDIIVATIGVRGGMFRNSLLPGQVPSNPIDSASDTFILQPMLERIRDSGFDANIINLEVTPSGVYPIAIAARKLWAKS